MTFKALASVDGRFFPPRIISWADLYPVIGIGGGLHAGKVRLHASVLLPVNVAADPGPTGLLAQMPVRFMGVIGFDIWRR
jgi:hypothetical protein